MREEVGKALTAAAGRVITAPPDEVMGAIVGEVLVHASDRLSTPQLTERKEEIEAKLDETLGTIKDELQEHKVDKAAKITGAAATAVVGGGLAGAVVTGALPVAALVLSVYGAYRSAKTAAPVVRVAAITTAATVSLSFDGYKSAAKLIAGRLRHK